MDNISLGYIKHLCQRGRLVERLLNILRNNSSTMERKSSGEKSHYNYSRDGYIGAPNTEELQTKNETKGIIISPIVIQQRYLELLLWKRNTRNG